MDVLLEQLPGYLLEVRKDQSGENFESPHSVFQQSSWAGID